MDDSSTDPSLSEDHIPIVLLMRRMQPKRRTRNCTVCNRVNQQAENEIPAVLGPALLDNTLNTTRLNADDPSTDEKVHQRITLMLLHSGGAIGRRGLLRVARYTIETRGCKMSVEAFPLDTKECAPMLHSHCTKHANSILTNVVTKRAQLRVVIR